jgi:hypothetical protein
LSPLSIGILRSATACVHRPEVLDRTSPGQQRFAYTLKSVNPSAWWFTMRRLLVALTLFLTMLCPVALPVTSQPATQVEPDPKALTVYVTRTGKKYHRNGCRYLAASKIPISLKDA